MIMKGMRSKKPNILIFGNISQPPFSNNLLPPVRAFQRSAEVMVIEPYLIDGFIPTGGARPAEVPEVAVRDILSTNFEPDVVICLAGGLFLPKTLRQLFPVKTIFAGFALSDPVGLEASLQIAQEFDLFYTADPQTLDVYFANGINIRRCDPAVDPELYRPLGLQPDCDMLFYGKWTPYRDSILRLLASRFIVHVHAHHGEQRWSVPTLPPLDTPQALSETINRARLSLEFTLLDDVEGQFRGTSRITNRPQFAAACGIPSLCDYFDRLNEFFEPGVEIEVFRSPFEALSRADALLKDEPRRVEMGQRARARVLADQTWDVRVKSILSDVSKLRADLKRAK